MKSATKRTLSGVLTVVLALAMLCSSVSAATVFLNSGSLDESEIVTFIPESDGTLTIIMGAADPGWSFQIIYPDGTGTLPKTGTAAGSYDYEVKADGEYQIIFQAYDKAGWTLGDGEITYDISFQAAEGEGEVVLEEYIVSDTMLYLGENDVTLETNAITTIYEFAPEETGTYRFTVAEGLLGYWGSGSFYLSDSTADKTNTLEQTVTSVGQSIMVGISGVESAVINVEKISDYQEVITETVIYEVTHVFGDYSFNTSDLVAIDIFDDAADVAVLGNDGFYRYGGSLGPIIVVDLQNFALNLNDAYINGQLSAYVTDENGVSVKYDYNEAMMAYYNQGLYPVTEELAMMLTQIGQTRGWYVPGGFLYPDATEIDAETGWMGFCSYVTGTEAPSYFVAGTFNEWNPADETFKMELQGNVYVAYIDVPNGKLELKVTDGTWDNCWPGENYVVYCGDPSTICVTFNPDTKEITVDGAIGCAHTSHMADGICSNCGQKIPHTYDENGFCTVCGTELLYYIHGYINGADYTGTGLYFTDGRMLVYLDQDSYIYLVDSDGNKYMTESYVETKEATFVKGGTEKMFIPGNEQVIIDMVVNEDGSVTLTAMYGSSFAKPTLTLDYPSLSFEDEILYNVYYTIDDTFYVEEMGLITFNERLVDGTIADAVDVIPGYVNSGATYMAQTNGIPAKNLSDAVYFKVYAKLDDGSYVYSDIAGYHAVAYANTVLNNASSSAKAKALVVAMLNYGAAAQEYFGYKTDALMNASLTAEQQALVTAYDSSMVQDVVKADASKVGSFVMNGGYSNIFPTVSFEGAFAINFYFTPNKAVDDDLTFYFWDAATYNSVDVLTVDNATGVLTMAQDGSNWGSAVSGIAAKAIDETVYVAAIYTSNGVEYPTGIVAYSLGNYCKTLANNGNAFGAATAVYGFYAKAYFAN